MSTIIVMQGGIAAGKSTKAREIVSKLPDTSLRVSKDDIRSMLHDSRHSKPNERIVNLIQDEIIRIGIENNQTVVVDNTNFGNAIIHISALAQLIDPNIGMQIIQVPIEVEEAIRRDSLRDKSVGEKVIRDYDKRYGDQVQELKQYVPNTELEKAVQIDLDGNLAIFRDSKNPYKRDFINDELNINLNEILMNLPFKKIILSGRSDEFKQETLLWLEKNKVEYDDIFMRKAGDVRSDVIVKREMFDKHMRNTYNVIGVFDDRLRIVRLWQSMGLFVFNTNQSGKEF